MAAEYCKLAGLRGLLFDDEVYYGRHLWTYQRLKYTSTTSADDYHDQVFERGARIMRAINTVYPEITILFLHGPTHAALSGGRRSVNRYEMMRAFFDGFLSECTGSATIIDGSERTYGYKEADQFEGAASNFRRARRPQPRAGEVRSACPRRLPRLPRLEGFSTEDFSLNYYSPEQLTTALSGA